MQQKPDSSASKSTPPAASPEKGGKPRGEKLDFEKLDLSVEEIEERISPSETNVFDK